jgi:hypothetical protein
VEREKRKIRLARAPKKTRGKRVRKEWLVSCTPSTFLTK